MRKGLSNKYRERGIYKDYDFSLIPSSKRLVDFYQVCRIKSKDKFSLLSFALNFDMSFDSSKNLIKVYENLNILNRDKILEQEVFRFNQEFIQAIEELLQNRRVD